MNAKRWISMVSLMAIFVGHLLLVHSVLADSAYLQTNLVTDNCRY